MERRKFSREFKLEAVNPVRERNSTVYCFSYFLYGLKLTVYTSI